MAKGQINRKVLISIRKMRILTLSLGKRHNRFTALLFDSGYLPSDPAIVGRAVLFKEPIVGH